MCRSVSRVLLCRKEESGGPWVYAAHRRVDSDIDRQRCGRWGAAWLPRCRLHMKGKVGRQPMKQDKAVQARGDAVECACVGCHEMGAGSTRQQVWRIMHQQQQACSCKRWRQCLPAHATRPISCACTPARQALWLTWQAAPRQPCCNMAAVSRATSRSRPCMIMFQARPAVR